MNMAGIKNIKAYEILDSRGNPTVKAEVILDNGKRADAAIPSGASKGTYEAVELRDNDMNRYLGMGVLKAVAAIEDIIAPKLKGIDPEAQEEIDKIMIDADGTENKSKLGANSILAVSLASARVAALSNNLNLYEYISRLCGGSGKSKLPTPMFNIINGGLHGCGKFNFQEFLLIPTISVPFDQALRMGAEIYQSFKKFLKEKNLIYSVGDEGGFTPGFSTNEEVLDFLIAAINKTNYSYSKDVYLGLDFAASCFYRQGFYQLIKDGPKLSKDEYINYLAELTQKYHLFSLEDGLHEDDWQGWKNLSEKVGKKSILVGDDLLVTNERRLQKAIDYNACNGIIIKPNQIGTLTETLDVVKLARKANFKIIISHRSGETNDDFIADLAAGTGADFAKFGAPARGERVAKYNRLLQIYHQFSKLD